MLYSVPRSGLIRLSKSLRLGGHLPGLTPISVEVSHATVEVIGLPGPESFIETRSQADAPNQGQARRLLDHVKLAFKGNRVQFFNPPSAKNQLCQSSLTITCPKNRPVTVRGVYTALRQSELAGGASVETTHARITMLNVGPKVEARVDEGIIDYSGHQGSASLFAGWEINLNFTCDTFTGKLSASANGPIRVLIPKKFATPFKATVTKQADFVCRADISSQINHRKGAREYTHTFGHEKPVIQLISRKGPIVIDNGPEPVEEIAANS